MAALVPAVIGVLGRVFARRKAMSMDASRGR
jgi:hypothetical protein